MAVIATAVLLVHQAGSVLGGALPSAPLEPPDKPVDEQPILVQAPGPGEPVTYGGTAMYDPCALLGVDVLAASGLSLDPATSVVAEYFPDSVPADRALPSAAETLGETSHCLYGLRNDGNASLYLYQLPYNSPRDLEFQRESVQRSGAALVRRDGLDIATWWEPDNISSSWKIVIGTEQVLLSASVRPDEDSAGHDSERTVIDGLVNELIKRLAAGPTGPTHYSYTGPYASIPPPCEIFTGTGFEEAFGSPAGGPVETILHLQQGPLNFPEAGVTLIRTEASCRRSTLVEGGQLSPDYRSVDAQFIYYDSDRDIKFADFPCDPNSSGQITGPPIPLDLKIGDGPVCLQRLGHTMDLSFRVGRVYVQLRNFQNDPPQQLARRLTPIALGIAANLAGTR